MSSGLRDNKSPTLEHLLFQAKNKNKKAHNPHKYGFNKGKY